MQLLRAQTAGACRVSGPARQMVRPNANAAFGSVSKVGIGAARIRPVAWRPARGNAVKVVAFRDKHRTEQLTSLADEFMKDWRTGLKEGPTAATVKAMDTILDRDVMIRCHHPLSSFTAKGLSGIRDKLHLDRVRGTRDVRVVLSAANDDDDVIFSLVEYTCMPEKGGKAEKMYAIIKLDALYDDTARRITDITERGTLGTYDMENLIGRMCPGQTPMEAVYPLDHIKEVEKELDVDHARATALAWCRARSTSHSKTSWAEKRWDEAEDVELKEILDDDNFQMWVPYSMLPQICAVVPDASRYPLSFNSTVDVIHDMKGKYDIHCRWIDTAVSQSHNVAFTHWKANVKPKEGEKQVDSTGMGNEEFVVEGFEVDIFNDEGKLKDVWLFRDPMDFERKIIMAA